MRPKLLYICSELLAVIPAKAGIQDSLVSKDNGFSPGESLPHSGGFAEEKRRPDYYLGNEK